MVDIKSALESGGRTIGYLTWYDCENAHVTPPELKNLFHKFNFDDKYFPKSIKPKNAFQKACRFAMNETGTSSDTRRSIVRIIVDGISKIVYGIVDLDVNQKAESISPDFSDKVWLDKDNWSVSYEHGHPTSKRIQAVYNRLCGEYTTRDISRMIVESVDKMCCVSLRDAGVVYFIPEAFRDDLHALQNVVNNIGQCNMRVYALGDKNGNTSGIENAAKSQIASSVENMKKKIADLKQSIVDGALKGKSAENSIEVRIRDFKELKNKCKILADALKIRAENLEGELDEVSKLIKRELTDVAA